MSRGDILPSRRREPETPPPISKRNSMFVAFALLTFVVSAINIHFHHSLHDEHVADASLREFQQHFRTSRHNGEAEAKIPRRNSINDTQKQPRLPTVVSSRLASREMVAGKNTSRSVDAKGVSAIAQPEAVLPLRLPPPTAGGHASNSSIAATPSFVRHDHVVIVTKIHGGHQWSLLEQGMCLLHHAYNHRVLYDIVVFSTEPVPPEDVESLRAVVAPAKFSVVVDTPGLQEEYAALPPAKQRAFLERCNFANIANLTWWSTCEGSRLGYNWQAEFRGLRLWHHPALADYKTMLWLDADAWATKPWEKDPVDYFVRNNGTVMFEHFPQGNAKPWIHARLLAGFNSTVCETKVAEAGHLVTHHERSVAWEGSRCRHRSVQSIHGFLHITDLDFYRSAPVRAGLEALYGDCFLCRIPDDQLAVTAPAVILAPERSWEMRAKGFRLDIFHNCRFDGVDWVKPAQFRQYWQVIGQHALPAAKVCRVKHSN